MKCTRRERQERAMSRLAPHVTQQKKREPNYGTTDLSFAFEVRTSRRRPSSYVKAASGFLWIPFPFPTKGWWSIESFVDESLITAAAAAAGSRRRRRDPEVLIGAAMGQKFLHKIWIAKAAKLKFTT